jgi:hypothetical protein
MTLTLDRELVDELEQTDRPCECPMRSHHPATGPCDQSPKHAARVRHAGECGDSSVFYLCQDCLDKVTAWAKSLIGWRCSNCRLAVMAVSDLVGPVVAL